MKHINPKQVIRVLPAVLFVLFIAASAYAQSPEFSVEPNRVDISGTFKGAQLRIDAKIPKDAQAVVEITGTTHEEHLLRKGRRGGLWMSVGEVKVKGAPLVYLVMTSNAAPSTTGDAAQTWGYQAIRKHMEFVSAAGPGNQADLFGEFVKLKESGGLYGIFPGSLKVTSSEGDVSQLVGHIHIPGNIAAGAYKVTLSIIAAGKTVAQHSTELTVHMKGLPALLDSLAHQHALVYGLVSVLIALVTGLVMGYVFKGKSAH